MSTRVQDKASFTPLVEMQITVATTETRMEAPPKYQIEQPYYPAILL